MILICTKSDNIVNKGRAYYRIDGNLFPGHGNIRPEEFTVGKSYTVLTQYYSSPGSGGMSFYIKDNNDMDCKMNLVDGPFGFTPLEKHREEQLDKILN